MSGTFYITGLQYCPCPRECLDWSKSLQIPNLKVVCLPKRLHLTREQYAREDRFTTLWRAFWPFLERRGIFPTKRDKREVERAFQEAYRGDSVSTSDTWLMRGYTFSPTIIFVDLEGKPWPIGGKDSFRCLFECFNREEVHFGKSLRR